MQCKVNYWVSQCFDHELENNSRMTPVRTVSGYYRIMKVNVIITAHNIMSFF